MATPPLVLGIPIPSTDPAFLAILAVHVPAGLSAAVIGLTAMLLHKGRGRHPATGTLYYRALAVVFVTASLLAFMRWAENRHLFALGGLSFGCAAFGRMAMRRRWRGFVRAHLLGMGLSYVWLLMAFYVDNGPHLPLWRSLPRVAHWLIPPLVGIPLIARAWLTHELVRRPPDR